MPLDESAAVLASTVAYGGSDSTAPSFNRSVYVRHTSRHSPKDLGEFRELDLRVKGDIGAELGSQTLFLRFRTSEEARIGLRGICLNRYTDQYISFGIKDSAGSPLTLDQLTGDGAVSAFGVPAPTDELPGIDVGYVLCGYWASGYAEQDCAIVRPLAGAAGDDGLDPRLYYGPIGGRLPEGDYELVIATSQWAKLPYELQLVIAPNPLLLGSAPIELPARGRLTLSPVAGTAAVNLPASGRLVLTYGLQGAAGVLMPASGTLGRTSPYDP